jgi:hypothetical protein
MGTDGPDSNEFGLARLGAAGPERAQWGRTQAEATRNERHSGKSTNRNSQEQVEKLKQTRTGDDTQLLQCSITTTQCNGNKQQWKYI